MKLKTRAQVKVAAHARLAADLVNGPLAKVGVEAVHPQTNAIFIWVGRGQLATAGHALWNNKAPETVPEMLSDAKHGLVDGVAVTVQEPTW